MSTITVTTTADNGNGSLRNAIAIAKSGDTIQFSKGLTGKTIALRSGQLTVDLFKNRKIGQAPLSPAAEGWNLDILPPQSY